MLDSLRKGAKTWIAKIFLVLLAGSFVAWGVTDMLRGGSGGGVAQVGDQEISEDQFRLAHRRMMDRFRQQLGNISDEEARKMGVDRIVLGQLINRAQWNQELLDSGVMIPDTVVKDDIQTTPEFQVNGRFDKLTFDSTIRNMGYGEKEFIRERRLDIGQRFYGEALTRGLEAPKAMAEALYRYQEEQRVIKLVSLRNAAITQVQAPTEDDIKKYYEAHIGDYTAPEYRTVSYVLVTPEAIAKTLQVDDDQLLEAYEERKAGFNDPEKRLIAQLLFQSEEEAQAAVDAIKGGKAFKEAGRYSPLGEVTAGALPGEIGEAAFNLAAVGDVSAPVKSPFGWHVLTAESITPGKQRSFDEVKDELRKIVALDHAVEQVYSKSSALEDSLAGGQSIIEAAKENGLEGVTIPAISRTGQNKDGLTVADLPKGPQFLESAFNTEEGSDSGVVDVAQGGFFILTVDAITPATPRALDTVKDKIVAALIEDRRNNGAELKADAIIKAINDGKSLEEAAEGLEVTTTEAVKRNAVDSANGLTPDLLALVFNAKPGTPVKAPLVAGAGYAVAVAASVEQADPSKDPETVEAIRKQLNEGLRNDVVNQYNNALGKTYPASYNPQALEALRR